MSANSGVGVKLIYGTVAKSTVNAVKPSMVSPKLLGQLIGSAQVVVGVGLGKDRVLEGR